MIFTTQSIATHVEMQFPAHYCHFREFQESPDYRLYWDKCMEAVRDRELLSHIIFCNDLLRIPPIKTFLLYYEQDLIRITGREDAALELFVKKAIGAFWGMVFKFTLGYQDQESVSVSLNQRFLSVRLLISKIQRSRSDWRDKQRFVHVRQYAAGTCWGGAHERSERRRLPKLQALEKRTAQAKKR